MKKQILNLGTALTKAELRSINGDGNDCVLSTCMYPPMLLCGWHLPPC